MAAEATPLMRQYNSIKQQVPGALLFFRLGDFYELFFEDAVTAARELEITLTSRNKDAEQPVPMCGVPYHAADGYLVRLIAKVFLVAICEQMELPSPGKKLVRREITRIVTPGTATDSNMLRSRENNYLAAVANGIEDYYTLGEAPGRWTGHTHQLLGIDSPLGTEQLTAVLAGRHPDTGVLLIESANRTVPAFDLTFRAPKSVGVFRLYITAGAHSARCTVVVA